MDTTRNDQNTLDVKIKQVLENGSKRQKMVAAYFLEHFDRAVFMTITQLAEAIGVSTATIVRFSNLLGYKSYSVFQKELQNLVKKRLKPPLRLSRKASINDNIHVRLGQYCKQHIENIQKSYERIVVEDFERAIDMIINSRWVWVIGLRGSFPMAHDFNFKLRQILRKSTLIELGAADYFETLEMFQPDDLVVGFSFSRFTKTTVDIVREGKKRGLKTLTFSDRKVSPLTPYADLNLVVESTGLTFTNSYVAVFSLTNCLLGEVSIVAKEQSVKNLEELDQNLMAYDAFYFA